MLDEFPGFGIQLQSPVASFFQLDNTRAAPSYASVPSTRTRIWLV